MSDDVYSRTNPAEFRNDIPTEEEDKMEIENDEFLQKSKKPKNSSLSSITGSKELMMEDIENGPHEDNLNYATKMRQVATKQTAYVRNTMNKMMSPPRYDAYNKKGQAPDPTERTYKEIMHEQNLNNANQNLLKEYEKVKKQEKEKGNHEGMKIKSDNKSIISNDSRATKLTSNNTSKSEWDKVDSKTSNSKWDNPVKPDQTSSQRKRRWDMATPKAGDLEATPKMNEGKYSETPKADGKYWENTPAQGGNVVTPGGSHVFGATPTPHGFAFNMATPSPGIYRGGMTPLQDITPDKIKMMKIEREVNERNKAFTDEELDQILPIEGYEIVRPPDDYQPIMTPSRKILGTPLHVSESNLYSIPGSVGKSYDIQGSPMEGINGIPNLKPDDIPHFNTLLNADDESKMTPEEIRDRKIMVLLLKVKNGTPPMRKSALRQITEKAREFGAGPLFSQILPLLISPTLEDQERHLLVKVIDRILFKLDDLVRPYVHKILNVISPLLIDQDYYARVEGREIISNLAKAAGLATMISTMRPDIDHSDENVRNVTSKSFAVVSSALGIPSVLPFLKAVCQSKKSWQARHTGIKIIQQIAILMGCSILPYLKNLVEIIEHGLKDEQQKVKTMTALAIGALAEAAYPYGYYAFDPVVNILFQGLKTNRGKNFAAFLKAVGFIIPLMDQESSIRYTKMAIIAVKNHFNTPDEDLKKIILKVIKQCVISDGLDAKTIKDELVDDYFSNFWTRRMALEKKNYMQLIETTQEIANKIGGAEIINRVVEYLKDENESFRKMTLEIIEKVVATLGVADINNRLEEKILDGLFWAFREMTADDNNTIINGFGTIVNCFGMRVKPYIPQICASIQIRVTSSRSAKFRQQAADLIGKIAGAMKTCGEEMLMNKLGVIIYENLGEEYPEVLGSLLGAMKAIVSVIGMSKMTPPIKDLLPRLTPILKNRHEKVQENCIDLIGRIADRGASFVTAKEWMRICFDLEELLKAHKKGIRRATINTFGYIAKAIGPQDVLVTLLNNLKVQERQKRVCTTVAIAIVAESCGPFTVIPALMNEYRVPELNVQNGVLKSFCFMFEYIGEMAKDYIYSVLPLLEDALTDRDLVHRQTAAAAIKHLSLGVAYLNCEDALMHLNNFLWPNIFETSPHVINAVMEGIEGLRVGLGVGRLMLHVIQGLFHPARRVRDIYWKTYNMIYIGAADSMVSSFPKIPNTEKNSYQRTELELFI